MSIYEDLDNTPEEARDRDVFAMGYPYYMARNEMTIVVTSDKGIFVVAI